MPLSQIEEKLSGYGFIRAHKGYLINYLFIRIINAESIFLTDGTSLPISKKRKEEIMQEYLNYSRARYSTLN